MNSKVALFIASLLIGFLLGAVLYLFDIVKTPKELLTHSILFGVSMFLFERYIRPVINKMFKKQKIKP